MLFCFIFFIFCVGSLLLFWIFLSLVIALPTIAIAIVVALSRKQKVKKNSLLWPSRASKIDNYSYCDSWKSNNFTESNTEKKQRTNTKNEAMTKIKKWSKITLRAKTIAIANLEDRYWKNVQFKSTKNYCTFWLHQYYVRQLYMKVIYLNVLKIALFIKLTIDSFTENKTTAL